MTDTKPRALGPLWELTRARILEFVRDPSAIFWVFVFPILLAVALGIAFRNRGPEISQVAVTGPLADALIEKLRDKNGERPFELKKFERQTALDALRTGSVDLIVNAQNIDGELPEVLFRYDPSRPGAIAVKLSVDDAMQRAYGRVEKLETTEQTVREKGGRYIDFLVPGLVGLNIMGSCMWGLGYAVVDSRRRKLLKRFAVTPMRRSHFLLAFVLSRLVFLVAEVAALVLFGWIVFDVAVRGSIAALAVLSLLGMFAFSGIALLIASRTESTETASGWMNFVQLPMWLVSGSFFAYSRFPEWLHPFIKALPLTALNDSVRGIVNEGRSLSSFLVAMTVLALWGALSFALALRVFRWQ